MQQCTLLSSTISPKQPSTCVIVMLDLTGGERAVTVVVVVAVVVVVVVDMEEAAFVVVVVVVIADRWLLSGEGLVLAG